jgi:DNA-binding response OmpR family regulator
LTGVPDAAPSPGEEVELTRREFDLLGTLMANPGRAYSREQLLDEAWGSRYVSEKTIDVHLVGLRRKLADAVRISTLRGVGYRLETDD